jgi:hypothetical protein
MEKFDPEFHLTLQGHAIAKYLGPRSPKDAEYDNHIERLHEFFRAKKWKGQLVINYPGNGGVNDIVFTEVRRMTEEKETK